MARPGLTTIKTLFALSCNRCAYPGCDQRLADPQWNGVRADIAHIRGEKPGAARYAPEMSDQERNRVENLMLLCPNHHREIDRLRPQDWSAEKLMELKAQHESECSKVNWATDSELEHYSSMVASADAEFAAPAVVTERPRLEIQKGTGDTYDVVNVGDFDAFAVRVSRAPGTGEHNILRLEDGQTARLSPGARTRACLHAKTFGQTDPVILLVEWRNTSGQSFDGEFPL